MKGREEVPRFQIPIQFDENVRLGAENRILRLYMELSMIDKDPDVLALAY